MTIAKILSYFPGIAFPLSYILNIHIMIKHHTASGANPWSYFSYYLANLAVFLFIKNYKDWRTIGAFIITAILEFGAVFFALHYNTNIHHLEKIVVYIVSFLSFIVVIYLFLFYKKKLTSWSSLAGYIPAIVFPGGTWFMYKSVKHSKDPRGVSLPAWILQLSGNIGGYFLGVESLGYHDFKLISAFLVTGLIDLFIIYELIKKKTKLLDHNKKKKQN